MECRDKLREIFGVSVDDSTNTKDDANEGDDSGTIFGGLARGVLEVIIYKDTEELYKNSNFLQLNGMV